MVGLASTLVALLLGAQPLVLQTPELRWNKTRFTLTPDYRLAQGELVVAELPVRVGGATQFRLDVPAPDTPVPPATGVQGLVTVKRPDGGRLWVTGAPKFVGLGGSF